MKKCPKCNNTMSDSSAFCDKCGTSLDGVSLDEDILESISTIPTVPAKKPKKKKTKKKVDTEELDIAPAEAPDVIPKVVEATEENSEYEIKDFFKDVSDGEEILSDGEDEEIPIEEMEETEEEPTVQDETTDEDTEEENNEEVEEKEEEVVEEETPESEKSDEETEEKDAVEEDAAESEESDEETEEEEVETEQEEETEEGSTPVIPVKTDEDNEEETTEDEEDALEETEESDKESEAKEEDSEEEKTDDEVEEHLEEKEPEKEETEKSDKEPEAKEEDSEEEKPADEVEEHLEEKEPEKEETEEKEEENVLEEHEESEEEKSDVDAIASTIVIEEDTEEEEVKDIKKGKTTKKEEEQTPETTPEEIEEEEKKEEKVTEEEVVEEETKDTDTTIVEVEEEKPKKTKKNKTSKKKEEVVEELEAKEEILEEQPEEETLEEEVKEDNKKIKKEIEEKLLNRINDISKKASDEKSSDNEEEKKEEKATEEEVKEEKSEESKEEEVKEERHTSETTPEEQEEKPEEEKKEEKATEEEVKEEKSDDNKEEEKSLEENKKEEENKENEEEPELIPGTEVEIDEPKKEEETTPKTDPPTTAPPVTAAPIMVNTAVPTEPPQPEYVPKTEPVQETVPAPVPAATTPFSTEQIPVQQPYVDPMQQSYATIRPYEVHDEDKDIKTNVSLVLGAISLVLCGMLPISLSGLLMAILSKERNQMRKIGIILNSVAVGIGVIALIVFIVYVSPKDNIDESSTFQGKGFSLKYDEKWKAVETQEGVRALQYNGEPSYFSQLGFSTLTDVGIKCDFSTNECKESVYADFLAEFENQKKDVAYIMKATSFTLLKDDIYYATFDYAIKDTSSSKRGKYYLLISENKNTALSFVSDTEYNLEPNFNNAIIALLNDISIIDNSGNAGSLEIEDENTPWVQYANLRTDAKGVKKSIYGEYRSLESDPCYWVITSNDQFYWYSSENERNDNYYQGKFNVRTGKDAMKLVGLKEKYLDTLLENSNGKFVASDVYGIVFYPQKWVEYGTSKHLATGTEMKHVWIIIDHGDEGIEAQALQFKKDGKIDTDVSMYMVKVKD